MSPVVRFLSVAALLLCVALLPRLGMALGDHGTADEAKAMAEKAATFLKEVGPETAFAAFNDKSNAQYHDRDLYVFVRSMDGNTVAHGANPGMIGHTNLELKDPDGKLYNKEMIDVANGKGSGWVDYRWVNPISKKIEPKSSFVVKVGDYVVGVGFYRD
ncbi:MAG TPA: cache domain-containing protein [Stellaceae bacterium]|nr:cache domain-containing protein [Stellaceae bacterium]